MDLLILFFVLSVGVSFLCSILEAVLLSVNMSYVAVLEKERPTIGKLLKLHKQNINKSIASILILNTIANTLGAAAVGAQASILFGNEAVVYVSVVLTFAILFLSEIIPKTIGAIYWKQLAPMAAQFIRVFIWITYPIILTTLFVTDKISKGKQDSHTLTKEELLHSMLLSEDDGIIDEKESDVIENILNLNNIKVGEILTPRSVVFALDETMSVKEIIETKDGIFRFSRIPLYKGSIENVTGLVLTKKIFKQALLDDSVSIGSIKKDIFSINENIPVSKALDLFIYKKDHMFLVKDNYDQTEGILTLEDCVETILGVEIVDESDTTVDMRELAKRKMKLKRMQESKEKE
ncbi:CNNM domain-containing protein [Sulfurimonas sp.]|uniref:CNNM domain-containing protein n=1 Tax=Sulfurimonas sp. TaxID=2022749 RepID=UPI00262FC992|nr:CNNM domain-containing protein [Sulfurimonas sp.]MCW8895416.1 CNNM domain-containing protein [Sulfurimonas sp.]MCW9066816.1 CNNM domain-containing protein [Sulfurimonas sp.]